MMNATVRDLRTRFPRIRRLLEQENEVIITDHGRPVAVLRSFEPGTRPVKPIDYYARLRQRMPKPISSVSRRALDEADRAQR